MRKNYQDKVVWITGASEGIGRALAESLAKEKARLILSARSKDKLEEVAESCRQKGAATTAIISFDLANDDEVDEACKKALALYGAIDLLLLNAGVSQRAFVSETTIDTFDRIMKINYLSNVRITINVLKPLLKNKGQIAVVSSLVGKFGSPYRSGYSASKHALHGFYDSLRAEHNNTLPISLICPGFIKTQLSLHALKGDGKELNEMDNAQAQGMPAEVFAARAIAGIRKGKAEMNIGGKEQLAVYLKRFFPGLFRRLISRLKVR
jgi:dehydrogenase/reductase SDR family protein 7B